MTCVTCYSIVQQKPDAVENEPMVQRLNKKKMKHGEKCAQETSLP